jgi:hypothetical protein
MGMTFSIHGQTRDLYKILIRKNEGTILLRGIILK